MFAHLVPLAPKSRVPLAFGKMLPETVSVPVNVSEVSDLRNEALLIPSSKSASSPEPEPSTVLISVKISDAV